MTHKFIICGASRSGKSTLSKRLRDRFDISWIIGDAIVSSLEDAFPQLQVTHDGDLRAIGDRFEEYIKYLLWNYDYEKSGYVFDSTHLYPRNIINMRKKIGDIPSIFLGYADADPEQKFQDIRRFDPALNWWTAKLTDGELMQHVRNHINKSKEQKQECQDCGIPYVDTSRDFEKALIEAEKILIG